MSKQELPVVAIIGRPNVGKSSLFNRLVGRRISIVHPESGVTRDRVASPVRIGKHHFILADTGGLGIFHKENRVSTFDSLIRDQIKKLIDEAEVLLWVVDATTGITPLDREIGQLLHETGSKKVIIAANKADNQTQAEIAENEFTSLGFSPSIAISCSHGRGLRELSEQLLNLLPAMISSEIEEPGMKLAVVGRPNVGKSSLVNALLGENRVIVSEIAGTTRDAIDIPIAVQSDQHRSLFTLIDTAGLRQKRRIDTAVELFSVMRAENAVKRSDAVIFMLDGSDIGSTQDRRIGRMINLERKPCIIVANKWDLAGKSMKMREMRASVERAMPFMQHAPIIGVCATSRYNLQELLNALFWLREQAGIKIPTSLLNQFLHDLFARTPPPVEGRRRLKFFYATMVRNPPPQFLLFVNDQKLCRANFRQFLENQLQTAFFEKSGLPVQVELRSRRESEPAGKSGSRRKPGATRPHTPPPRIDRRPRKRG